MSDITTMRIHRDTLTALRKKKQHPRETDEDVIKRLLKDREVK